MLRITPIKRIAAVKTETFSELGFTERKHLQEWLAYEPSALGEELLIIQKEFDGFDDTRERLDLLALDKDGNLVIIENKLDDSGRDVVWQSLKYASYCASLTKLQLVEIFQQFINRYEKSTRDSVGAPANASSQICEFFDAPDLDEVKLNQRNSQGLINIDQIIPTPEAKELMIGIRAKEAEEKTTEVVRKNRHNVRRNYWERVLEVFQSSPCTLYNNISPNQDHWLPAGSGLSGCPYALIFLQKELRVRLTLERISTEENKFLFDFLYEKKEKIEESFDEQLEWLRCDEQKSSRIQYTCKAEGLNKEKWPEWVKWHLDQMTKLEKAFKAPLQQASEALKNQKFE